MPMKISELVQIKEAITPQNIATADVTSPYYSMSGIGRVLAVLTTSTIAAGQNATVQFMQAQDALGTGAKELGTVVAKVAGTGGEALFVQAEAQASDLDIANGYSYVAVKVGSNDPAATPPTGAAILIFGDLSFRG